MSIDDLSFQLSSLLIIKQPKVNDAYPLIQESYIKTADITFQADDPAYTGQVNWATTVYYETSGNRGPFTVTDAFTSQANTPTTRTFKSQGGRLSVGASEPGRKNADPIQYAYIIGTAIPNSDITSRLYSLYNGVTPNLLCGIADRESSYMQFSNITLFGYTGRWPYESYDGGSHIGLMQVPITMAYSWDWQVNTQTGANIFAEKVQLAKSFERQLRKTYPRLPRLTDSQIENMALVLYGPEADPDPYMQYYIPQGSGNNWQWVENTANNPEGVPYANDVRDRAQKY